MTRKVWIIDLPVHVIADTVEKAREMLGPISDRGPVVLTAEEGRRVTVVYVNYPEDRGHDGDNPYDLDEQGLPTEAST